MKDTQTRSRLRHDLSRWWTYQRERFPLHQHGPLVALLSIAAVSYAAILTGTSVQPTAVAGAFVVGLTSFLLLRIADEVKDADLDAQYRPHRPVPRGLVSLDELTTLGAWLLPVQAVAALLMDPILLLPLLVVWGYGALMSVEFFAADWLRRHPTVYLLSHAVIVPLIDGLLAAFQIAQTPGLAKPAGLAWLLAASLFGSLTFEIGRKMRAPENEQPGVDTYTKMWGRPRALIAWLVATTGVAVCAGGAILYAGGPLALLLPLLAVAAAPVVVAARFHNEPTPAHAGWMEPVSGAVLLANYAVIASLILFV